METSFWFIIYRDTLIIITLLQIVYGAVDMGNPLYSSSSSNSWIDSISVSNLYLHFEQINLITFLLNLIENEIKLKYSKIYVDKHLFSIYNTK